MKEELKNDNILKLNMIKDDSLILNFEEKTIDNDSQTCEININTEQNIIKEFLSKEENQHLSKKLQYLHIMELLSKYKMKSQHNCTLEMYNTIIAGFLVDNADCHLVAIFKEKMLSDYLEEFLRREYTRKECNQRIPKFSKYYRNYSKFFCKAVFRDFRFNKIINKNGEKKAEIYYKNNYQGGKTKDDDENNGFAKSSSSDEDMKKKGNKNNINDLKNLAVLFDENVRENIENVTIMTSLDSSNNTINLKLDNEKIEVFSENKCDKSNETTLFDIMDIIKNKKNKKNIIDALKKEIIQQTDTNINNNMKSMKSINSQKNIKKKEDENIINNTTNNIDKNINNITKINDNKNILKLSPKINKEFLQKTIKDSIKKLIENSQNINNKNKLIKNNITNELKIDISKNKSTSKNNKNILINTSDILKNNSNNKNKNKSNINRSRNKNIGFLYKQTYTNYNNYNNNINLKRKNVATTTLYKMNKLNYNNNLFSSINNMNYPIKNNYNSKINIINNKNNNIALSMSKNKFYVSNISLENKATSMKILDTYMGYNSNDRDYKNKNNKLKLSCNNLKYKLGKQNTNNYVLNTNNNNYININKYTESINSNNKSNTNNDIIINNNISDKKNPNKFLGNNNASTTKCRQQHYNSLAKKIKNKVSISNKKKNKSIDPTHIIGKILYEGNSSTSNQTFNNNNNYNNYNMNNVNKTNYSKIINNNNILHINQNSLKELKKYYNYNNVNNNYNINISNQIIINTNPTNNSYNTNLKEFLNNNNPKKHDNDLFKLYKSKNIVKFEKSSPSEDNCGINNLKLYRTRNINSNLNQYYTNPSNSGNESQNKNSLGLNKKIIKSYHNKKYSGISDLLNDNKKLLFLKNKSKSKKNNI